MKLSLAPIPYYWSSDKVFDFYQKVAEWPVDIVYLGETVCARRRAMKLEDWLEVAELLTRNDKEVVLSTLTLLEAESELASLKRICNNDQYMIEANDAAALYLLAGKGGFVVGPHINTYNTQSLTFLTDCGARRWVMPVELGREVLNSLQTGKPSQLQTEVFAFGHLPLSFSARCFTARALNLPKDQCGFHCSEYDTGMPLYSQDDSMLFNINGIQLQSGRPCNLLAELEQLRELGVDVIRLSPEDVNMQMVVQAYRDVIVGRIDAATAQRQLDDQLAQTEWCNGYWYGEAGMAFHQRDSSGLRPA